MRVCLLQECFYSQGAGDVTLAQEREYCLFKVMFRYSYLKCIISVWSQMVMWSLTATLSSVMHGKGRCSDGCSLPDATKSLTLYF